MTPDRPASVRRAERAYKDRLKAAGLKQVSLWIKPEDEEAVRTYDKRNEVKKSVDDCP